MGGYAIVDRKDDFLSGMGLRGCATSGFPRRGGRVFLNGSFRRKLRGPKKAQKVSAPVEGFRGIKADTLGQGQVFGSQVVAGGNIAA